MNTTAHRLGVVVLWAMVTLAGVAWGPPAAAQSDGTSTESSEVDLAKLIEQLRPEDVLTVSFEERLSLPYLTQPVTSEGTMTMRSDGLLIRQVAEPNPTAVVMRGSSVVMRDSTGVSRLDLSTTPEAAVAVSLLRLLFTGDVSQLKKRYEIEQLEGASESSDDDAVWTLRLTPRGEAARKVFTSYTLVAEDDRVRQLTLNESDDSVRVIDFGDARRVDELPSEDRELLKTLGMDVVDE